MGGMKRIVRVARVFEAIERVRQVDWLRQEVARAQVEDAARANQQYRVEADGMGRRLLEKGEIEPWRMLENEQQILAWRGRALAGLLEERSVTCRKAHTEYTESRKRTGQTKCLLEAARSEEKIKTDRHEQTEADARFLARALWRDLALFF